jgi:hypothetical protein
LTTVRCGACGAQVEPPRAAGPFFCSQCQAIIDPTGALKAPVPQSKPADSGPPAPHTQYVSRYATATPRDKAGPGTRFNVGGSVILAYLLGAVAAVVFGGGLAWVAAHHLRLPILYPLIAGWGIRRALALGGGGGTPDRGPVGFLLLLAICAATYVGGEYVAYRADADRESTRWHQIYGVFPVTDDKQAINDLKNRDPDLNGEFTITVPDEERVVILEEKARLENYNVTHEYAAEPYDVKMLAMTGKAGFPGHVAYRIDAGEDLRIMPQKVLWHIPGFGVVVLWIVEFTLLCLAAFARVD